MHIHILQHVGFEGEGHIADWAAKHNALVTRTCFFNHDALPSTVDFDLLVVMGGPMGIYDEADYPYLVGEKAFIKQALQKGTKVLGICLGSQLLADALGAKVFKNASKEIGWFPIHEGTVRHPLFNHFYPQLAQPVFHWHGDTFDLPANCDHLFKSAVTQNQAFIYNNQAIGLQFHLELKPANLEALIDNCASELMPGQTIQTSAQLQSGLMNYQHHCQLLLLSLLDNWMLK